MIEHASFRFKRRSRVRRLRRKSVDGKARRDRCAIIIAFVVNARKGYNAGWSRRTRCNASTMGTQRVVAFRTGPKAATRKTRTRTLVELAHSARRGTAGGHGIHGVSVDFIFFPLRISVALTFAVIIKYYFLSSPNHPSRRSAHRP